MLAPQTRGFSLVEMVISIAMIGALAVMATPLLRLPVTAWQQASQRTELVQTAAAVESLLTQDLQAALPGSVRVRTAGGRTLVEMLQVRAQGRYRTGAGGAGRCPVVCGSALLRDALMIAPGCNDGCFVGLGALEFDPANPPLPNDWVIVPGNPLADPYVGGNVAVPGGAKARLMNVATFAEGPRVQHTPHRFGTPSAAARYYIVAGTVSWDFNVAAGTVRRAAGYPVAAVQPIAFGGAASNVVLADGLRAAVLRLQAGPNPGSGSLLVRAQFERSAPGGLEVERFELASQHELPEVR